MMSTKMKGEKVFFGFSPSCLGRAMVALSISGRLRRPPLAPNVWYMIRRYLGSIAMNLVMYRHSS